MAENIDREGLTEEPTAKVEVQRHGRSEPKREIQPLVLHETKSNVVHKCSECIENIFYE